MSTTVTSAKVREPKPAAPAEVPASAPAPTGPAVPEPAAFWGDRFAVRLWFAGASILAVLHLVDWLYHALRP